MSFESTLRDVVDGCGGGLAIALMGSDGLPIEQVAARHVDSDVDAERRVEDITAAGVEFGHILKEVRKASDALGGGAPRECVFVLSRFTIVVHEVDSETFVALALAPDGNLGKARYLIRRDLHRIREEL